MKITVEKVHILYILHGLIYKVIKSRLPRKHFSKMIETYSTHGNVMVLLGTTPAGRYEFRFNEKDTITMYNPCSKIGIRS